MNKKTMTMKRKATMDCRKVNSELIMLTSFLDLGFLRVRFARYSCQPGKLRNGRQNLRIMTYVGNRAWQYRRLGHNGHIGHFSVTGEVWQTTSCIATDGNDGREVRLVEKIQPGLRNPPRNCRNEPGSNHLNVQPGSANTAGLAGLEHCGRRRHRRKVSMRQ